MKPVALCLLAALLSAPTCARASEEQAGDEFRITLFHESETTGDNGSSSSSSGGHEYLERILAVRADGVERVYDIPLDADDEERLINWQFPVRIFEANDGSLRILNRAELEQRRDAWLKAAELPAKACGTWYFTWNAFQVECDPDAIIETIRAIRIQPENLSDGASLEHPAALKPGRLAKVEGKGADTEYSAQMPVDPDYFHRADAQSDVVVGEIMRKPVSFEQAYQKRLTERITGTIKVVLESNSDGRVWRRVTSIETVKTEAGGEAEHTVSTETVERREHGETAPEPAFE